MKENCLITFISVNQALAGEIFLEEKGIKYKTIPTPREVETSCGLSILLDIDYKSQIVDYISEGLLKNKDLYIFIKDKSLEKIIV